MRHWLRSGAPADKLVMGMATYGRTYTLANANSPGIGAASTGPGYSGKYTQEASFLGYNEVTISGGALSGRQAGRYLTRYYVTADLRVANGRWLEHQQGRPGQGPICIPRHAVGRL